MIRWGIGIPSTLLQEATHKRDTHRCRSYSGSGEQKRAKAYKGVKDRQMQVEGNHVMSASCESKKVRNINGTSRRVSMHGLCYWAMQENIRVEAAIVNEGPRAGAAPRAQSA